MDERSYTIRLRKKWAKTALVVAVAALIVAPLTAVATHNFNDVPNSNTFHNNIEWLSENDVTRGCNPPSNSLFCPEDNVTREQMAAFMQRLAQTFGAVGDDTASVASITSNSAVELLSVTVTPKDEAQVVLNAHVSLGKQGSNGGVYRTMIHRGTCDGPIVAEAVWVSPDGAAFDFVPISITGLDTVSSDTTYKLCALKQGTSPNVVGVERGMTATWLPTS
jgi:hypothetical protein